ncbi:MAG: histidine kinase [Solirubrobacterales bacterium]
MIGLRRVLWALAIAGFVVLVAETVLIAGADFGEDRGLWIALDWVIGGGFVGVGLFAWYRRPENRVGTLMVGAGFAWFLSVAGFSDPPFLFTLGILFDSLFAAVAIHLVLAFPTGRLESRLDRLLVGCAYLVTTVGYLPFVLFVDPVTAFECANCPENVFLVADDPGFAETWGDALNVVGITLLPAVLVRLAVVWWTASAPLKRIVTPIYLAGVALMAMLTALLVAGLAGASKAVQADLFYATLIPFGLVPYLFLATLARARMLRGGAVGKLVTRLSGALGPGELPEMLAKALGDPSLELAYWLPESERYVDAEGHTVELPGSADPRAVSDVVLHGKKVAAIVHDPLLLDEPELIEAVSAAASLSLEKERLRAELAAKVEELRDQRSRVLAVGLAERRRLERDLHDGAQQRLVSLALDLRMAQSSIRDDPETAERLLGGAGGELERALEELRELARGLHPAVLADRGLDAAVGALAGRAPLPVQIERELGERVPEAVELAAYFVVAESLTNVVKYAEANQATVRMGRDNGKVVVEVADDGVGGADPGRGTGLRGLEDRVSSLGGEFEIDSSPGAGTTVVARIPCE